MEDKSSFDGWYAQKADAEGVYGYWCEKYPQRIVALVKQDRVRFPDSI